MEEIGKTLIGGGVFSFILMLLVIQFIDGGIRLVDQQTGNMIPCYDNNHHIIQGLVCYQEKESNIFLLFLPLIWVFIGIFFYW